MHVHGWDESRHHKWNSLGWGSLALGRAAHVRICSCAPGTSISSCKHAPCHHQLQRAPDGMLSWQIVTVDEAKTFYPLFGLGANVALIFSGRAVKYFSQVCLEPVLAYLRLLMSVAEAVSLWEAPFPVMAKVLAQGFRGCELICTMQGFSSFCSQRKQSIVLEQRLVASFLLMLVYILALAH